MKKKPEIIPSLLGADQNILEKSVKKIEYHVKTVHIDVMDGQFVPQETFGPEIVELLDTRLHKEVHLMTLEPEKKIEEYAAVGAGTIIVHAEVFDDVEELRAVLKKIKKLKAWAGVSIEPETPVEKIRPVLKDANLVLVMTVHPGRGGQKMLMECLDKVKKIRRLNKKIDIEVDGGVNKETIRQAVKAGANKLVAGSAIFSHKDPLKGIVELEAAVG